MNKSFSFQQQNIHVKHEDEEAKKIKIIHEREISSLVLIQVSAQKKNTN